ncbi:MAG TPA: hypothetical protein VIJ46_06775 [Rhabdochlamydiaceae bacterium]
MSITPVKTSDSISLAQLMLKNCEEKMESKAAKGVLTNYRGLMGLARAALSAFLAGDLPDPLVGENACQIRAALYAHIIQDGEMMTDLKKVCALIEKNHGSLEHIKLPEGKARYSVMDVLQSQQLDLCVPLRMSSVIGPILFGHILTVTKLSDLKIEKAEVSLKESNDPKLLQGLSVGFAKDIIREGRKVLSNCSIQYLRNEVRLLPMSSRIETLCTHMEKDVLSDPLGLQTAPLLPGMEILLASMKSHHTPIVLRDRMIDGEGKEIGKVELLFAPTGKEGKYEAIKDLAGVDRERGAFVIEAVAISDKPPDCKQLASSLVEIGIETIILANSAAHPQYGGANKTVEFQTAEREALKERALKLGLCASNPELCRIYHIFAGMVSKNLKVEAIV